MFVPCVFASIAELHIQYNITFFQLVSQINTNWASCLVVDWGFCFEFTYRGWKIWFVGLRANHIQITTIGTKVLQKWLFGETRSDTFFCVWAFTHSLCGEVKHSDSPWFNVIIANGNAFEKSIYEIAKTVTSIALW